MVEQPKDALVNSYKSSGRPAEPYPLLSREGSRPSQSSGIKDYVSPADRWFVEVVQVVDGAAEREKRMINAHRFL